MKQNKNQIKDSKLSYFYNFIHVIVIAFVIFIFKVCIREKWVLYTWHPILASIGWGLLATEGIITFSPYNTLTSGLLYSTKIRYHWIIQTIGAVTTIAGYFIVIIDKEYKEEKHFVTWHGFTGLITIFSCYAACITGVFTLYGSSLKKYIRPINSKLVHNVSGVISFTAGLICMSLSMYTNWLQDRIYQTILLIWFVAILTVLLITVAYPLATVYRYVRKTKREP